ncbi:hypothetical protein GA0061101_12744 [Rhizobium lusitanum]|uniref:Uncharacterized protein n=1 Tax=Rhizobium lusitanum TaxID=293958 RepID=A0A1C3X7K3_9HYPH|nr:hypothetical protein GA0061101_12744 [Rhizobium lusitanum]
MRQRIQREKAQRNERLPLFGITAGTLAIAIGAGLLSIPH